MSAMAIAAFVAGGATYFIGLALLTIAILGWPWRTTKLRRALTSRGLAFGLLLVALSATPTPLWLCGLVGAMLGIVAFARFARPQALPRLRVIGPIAFAALFVLAAAFEARHWPLPRVTHCETDNLYVIADSLSAGVGPLGEMTWPRMLAKERGFRIVDLSKPGATLPSALEQAAAISSPGGTVILEIGGNDLLDYVSAGTFERNLRTLLKAVAGPGRALVMFELPLPPVRNAIGAAQRRVASEFDVVLVPKRILAGIIGPPQNTLDGLHLSEAGHRAFADQVRRILDVRPANR